MGRLLLLLFFFFSQSAFALRDDLCRSLGKGLELFSETNCREGSQAEYDLACAQVSFGHKYNHGDVRWNSFQSQGFDSVSDLADGLTEEVLMNLAAQNIAESNRCMVNFYNEYLANSGAAVGGVKAAFSAAKPKLEALLPPQGSDRRISFLKPSSELVNKSRTIDIVKRDPVDGPRVSFDAIIASIPLGNHEEIRNYVAKAMVENYTEEKFFSGYQAEVRKLKAKHESSLNSILAYRVNPNRPTYNVREGDRGSLEIRQSLIDSGAIENYIIANGLESQFAPGFLCRRKRQEKGCIALIAIEFAGSFALPYVSASIGLRAGVAMASRGLTSWNSARFVGHAVSRGLLFSGYVGQLSLLTDDAIEQCLVRHPEYLKSKSQSSCEPKKMVFEAASEASMADCLSSVALGLAPIGIMAIADDALRALRVETKIDDFENIAKALSAGAKSVPPPATGNLEEAEEFVIVVEGKGRELYISNGSYSAFKQAMRNNNLNPLDPESLRRSLSEPSAWNNLRPREKVFALEVISGRTFRKAEGLELERGFQSNDRLSLDEALENLGLKNRSVAAADTVSPENFLPALTFDRHAAIEVSLRPEGKGFPPAFYENRWVGLSDEEKLYVAGRISELSFNRHESAIVLDRLRKNPPASDSDIMEIIERASPELRRGIPPVVGPSRRMHTISAFEKVDKQFIAETEDYLAALQDLTPLARLAKSVGETVLAKRMLNVFKSELESEISFLRRKLLKFWALSADEKAALKNALELSKKMLTEVEGFIKRPDTLKYQKFIQLSEALTMTRYGQRAYAPEAGTNSLSILQGRRDAWEKYFRNDGTFFIRDDAFRNSVLLPTDRPLTIEEMNAFSDRRVGFLGVTFENVVTDGVTFLPPNFFTHDVGHLLIQTNSAERANLISRTFSNVPSNQEKLRQFLWFYYWHEKNNIDLPLAEGMSSYVGFIRALRDRNSEISLRLNRRIANPRDFGEDPVLRRQFEESLEAASRDIERNLLSGNSP